MEELGKDGAKRFGINAKKLLTAKNNLRLHMTRN